MKQRKPFLSNQWIIVLKVISACFLLFIASFFFFQNMEVLVNDFRIFTQPPAYFLLGIFLSMFFLSIVVICAYIIFLLVRMDEGKTYRADRFDIGFKFLYSLMLLYIAIRSFFLAPYLNVPIPLIVIALVFGVFNWMIPKLYYHDSQDF